MKWFLMSGAALVLGVTMSGAVLAKGSSCGSRSQPSGSSHCQPTYHEPVYHQPSCPAPVYQQPVKHDSDEFCLREEDHPEWSCRWWSEEHHCWFFWSPPMKTWFYWCNNCHKFYPMSAMEHMPPTGHEPEGYESLPRMGPDGKVEALPPKHSEEGPPGGVGHDDFTPGRDGFKPGKGVQKDPDGRRPDRDGEFKPGKGVQKDPDGRRPEGDDGFKPGKGVQKDADGPPSGKHGSDDSKKTDVKSQDAKGLPPAGPATDNGTTALYKGADPVSPGIAK
jgi:hypothetical protein